MDDRRLIAMNTKEKKEKQMKRETIKIDDVEYIRKDAVNEQPIIIDDSKSVAIVSVGMQVLVRSRNEGVNCGIVMCADETGIVLSNARRLWYHKPKEKSTCWYEGVAMHGISDDSKVSCTVSKKIIVEDYSITECTTEAFESIMNQVPHAQS